MKKNEIQAEIRALESIANVSGRWNLPENTQKPCLAMLFESDFPVGERNLSNHIIACDLINRQNKPIEYVKKMLLEKNKTLTVSLPEREIVNTINSASRKKIDRKAGEMRGLTYGCNNPILLRYCNGKDQCQYYKQSFVRGYKGLPEGIQTYVNKGWLSKLSGNEFKVYAGVCKLEHMKGIRPGNTLIFTHREMAKITGIARQTAAEVLKNLHFEDLIIYRKGRQHKKHKIASEVIRVLPIPEVK